MKYNKLDLKLGFYLAVIIKDDSNFLLTSKTPKSPNGRIYNIQITFTFH